MQRRRNFLYFHKQRKDYSMCNILDLYINIIFHNREESVLIKRYNFLHINNNINETHQGGSQQSPRDDATLRRQPN